MFQVMKRGWTRTELNDFTNSLKKNFNSTNYSINIHRGSSVNELFGFVNENQKDAMILEAFEKGEQITIFKDNTLRNIRPIIPKFKSEVQFFRSKNYTSDLNFGLQYHQMFDWL